MSSVECPICYREFNHSPKKSANENSLKQHMQVHEDRNIFCPMCNKKKFKSVAGMAAHYESGYCDHCTDSSQARRNMWEFARRNPMFEQYRTPMLEYDNVNEGSDDSSVPDFPYRCNYCHKEFRQQSSMYQHIAAKHA